MIRAIARGVLAALFVLASSCALALPVPTPGFRRAIRIDRPYPQAYTLRLITNEVHEYSVAADGKAEIDIPSSRRGCDTILFGILIRRGADPVDHWSVEIRSDGEAIRSMTLRQLLAIRPDAEGYRQIALKH